MLSNTMKSTSMYSFVCIMITLLMCVSNDALAQNCTNDETGLTPIPELGSSLYLGFQGGLYFGSDIKPVQHVDALNGAISKITPLNGLGLPDGNGSIVLLSIGASNPKTEFESFQTISSSYGMINPYLKLVNGSQGGNGLQKIIDPDDKYWQFVMNQLSAHGLSRHQVQIIWLEQENTQSNTTHFPEAPIELMGQFKELFEILLTYFPNIQICYLTARGYAGYIDPASTAGKGLRQPRDYYHGWAMKWLIEDQINGDSTLTFNGPNRKAPVLDWSAYLWADGSNVRKDGFSWNCPTDVKPNDGLHWSQSGNDKAGHAIFQRFLTDQEARKWFTNSQTTALKDDTPLSDISIFPNPSLTYIHVYASGNERFDLYIYNILGQVVWTEQNMLAGGTINHQLPAGFYHIVIKSNNTIVNVKKMSVGI